jgi:S-formylglutathione hydrolase FrmB
LSTEVTRRSVLAAAIALHGHGGNADWVFDNAHIERHVASTALAVATIDGGNFYWHARRSGIDPGSMVVQELLPLLAGKGLETSRIALIGWSMGGYGALLGQPARSQPGGRGGCLQRGTVAVAPGQRLRCL